MSVSNSIDQYISINKAHSYRLKGIAVIMMVSMHLMTQEWMEYPDMLWDIQINGSNLSYFITQSVHASSAIFAFLTGYAWGVLDKTDNQYKMNKVISIYISYWIISLLVNLPCLKINGVVEIKNIEEFVLCMLALSSKLSSYCWYVAFYAFSVITFPVIKVVINNLKCNVYIKILLTIFFFYGIRVIVKVLAFLGFNNLTIKQFLSLYGATMPILVIGYLVRCYDLLSVIDEKMRRVSKSRLRLIAILFLSLLSIIRGYLICILEYKSSLEALWIIFEIYCIFILTQRVCKVECVDKLLEWLGKQSLYIWLVHSVFMLANIQKFTFILHFPVLVIIMVILISALISLPVEYVDKKVQSRININTINEKIRNI